MDLDYKNVKVGDEITAISYTSRFPVTVLEVSSSGKTIIVGYNNYIFDSAIKSYEVKKIPLKNVLKNDFHFKTKYKWASDHDVFYEYESGRKPDFCLKLGEKGWKNMQIDFGCIW